MIRQSLVRRLSPESIVVLIDMCERAQDNVVRYGRREAGQRLRCGRHKARAVFGELMRVGAIVRSDDDTRWHINRTVMEEPDG